MADQFKDLQQQTSNETQRLTTQLQVAEKKIERVIYNFGETKIFEKITGPLEKIMASVYKINRFTEDPIHNQIMLNIIQQKQHYNKINILQILRKESFLFIDECFRQGNKIKITATRSIKANAESEFYKEYLIKIIESTQAELKTKTLLRKDLKLQKFFLKLGRSFQISCKQNFLLMALIVIQKRSSNCQITTIKANYSSLIYN